MESSIPNLHAVYSCKMPSVLSERAVVNEGKDMQRPAIILDEKSVALFVSEIYERPRIPFKVDYLGRLRCPHGGRQNYSQPVFPSFHLRCDRHAR